ncbi:hypothetical protein N665_0632s0005 [Sinapis alba]|nr:hypothetical protein N665_0632s0005 [Sinapis alba]
MPSANFLTPRPPSLFGVQTTSHDTFAFLALRVGPDHKNAEHKLLISFMHCPGSLKPVIQKFTRLIRTDRMSCNLPAIERNRFVHKLMRCFIFSMSTL